MCETIHIFDDKDADYQNLIFDILKKKYALKLRSYFESCIIPKQSEKSILLLCRNFHPDFEFILHNCVYFSGGGWSITVLCSEMNYEFCRVVAGNQADSILFLKVFKESAGSEKTTEEFKTILSDPGFYSLLPWKHIWIVPMHCYFRKPIPSDLPFPFIGQLPNLFYLQTAHKESFLLQSAASLKQEIICKDTVISDPLVCENWWSFFRPTSEAFHSLLHLNVF